MGSFPIAGLLRTYIPLPAFLGNYVNFMGPCMYKALAIVSQLMQIKIYVTVHEVPYSCLQND